jgi:hypothetical protein
MILQERGQRRTLEGEKPKSQQRPRDRAPAWTSLTTVAISIS